MRVAIRADATPLAATGHLMRCLTLAEALRAIGSQVLFICRAGPGDFNDLARDAGFQVRELFSREGRVGEEEDAAETAAALRGMQPDWVVVDHYGLGLAWEKRIRSHVGRILAIDDLADRSHDCDVLLDQNLRENPQERYLGRLPPTCVGWFGPKFLLLREEFRHSSGPRRVGPVRRVFIAFGGVDAANNTLRAIGVVSEEVGIEADVVIGKWHPSHAAVEEACARAGMRFHVQSARMAEIMENADLAISACGFTAYELVAMQVPAILAPVTWMQVELAAELARLGAAVSLPFDGALDEGKLRAAWRRVRASEHERGAMIEACRGLIDGHGAQRVAEGLVDHDR